MHSITLELADNGLIKIVNDDNINAAGEDYQSVTVYDFEGVDALNTKIKFLMDIAMDAGVELGSPRDKSQIKISHGWGDAYTPSKEEISKRIEELRSTISQLEKRLNS
jgi:hypothetical protein